MAAVLSGVAERAPLIVTRPPRVRDSDWSLSENTCIMYHVIVGMTGAAKTATY